jgi:protein-tyrosine kinase
MSRIEEALKRAAPAVLRAGAALDDGIVVRPEPTTLAHFPKEAGPSGERPRRSVAAAAPATRRMAPLSEELDSKLVAGHPAPVAVEQYRRLAGALHELQGTHGTKTLMVTSAVPREGKTLTVTNLALTLSESFARRVLLIDADLRRPSIHEVLSLPNASGLNEGLRNDAGDLSLIQVSAKLSVLTAGRPESNPMAGLTSERMRALLEEAAGVFDWILLDAPPVGIMPDAHLLAGLTDGVIFVIAAGVTPHALVERAISEIGRDQIVGTVLNRVDPGSIAATGYYEQYYSTAEETPRSRW